MAFVPYLRVETGHFGSDMIFLLISFDKKENWPYGYVENSNYVRISITNAGKVEAFAYSLYKKGETCSFETRLNNDKEYKFRNFTAKDFETAKNKILSFVTKINDYYME